MATRKLTELQQQALDAATGAKAGGVGLSAYARANGLNVRQMHDAVLGLRKRGVLPPTATPRPRRSKQGFVRVKVLTSPATAKITAGAAPRGGIVCRLVHGSGVIIECGEWPPAPWLAAVLAERRDAAS